MSPWMSRACRALPWTSPVMEFRSSCATAGWSHENRGHLWTKQGLSGACQIAHHVDHGGAVGGEGLAQRRGELVLVVDGEAVAVESLGDPGEVDAGQVHAVDGFAAVGHLAADLAVAAVVGDDHGQGQ